MRVSWSMRAMAEWTLLEGLTKALFGLAELFFRFLLRVMSWMTPTISTPWSSDESGTTVDSVRR
jgi:hypothetical protein